MKNSILILVCSTFFSFNVQAQLTVNAGKDTTFCTGQNIDSLLLGTTAKIENGIPPFSIQWECKIPKGLDSYYTASDLLSDTTILSPRFLSPMNPGEWIKFTLHVTDSENNYSKDSIFIRFSIFGYLTGGGQTRFYIEKGDSILLKFNDAGIGGGIPPLNFNWQPKTYLSNPDSFITWCKPDSSIQYEIFAIDSCGCVSYPELAYDIRVLPENPSYNYQTVYSNRVALFDNSENQINALRIDSVKVDKDSVLYPFATIQEVSENCFSPYKASWIGEKVVIKPDGTNLFFNREGDTISLKTRAGINDKWIAFQRSDDFRVKATVQSIELENFMGLTDTVKTISLTVIDQNENTIDHALNKLEIKISRTYGFIETLNFYLFPDITVRSTGDQLKAYSLIGLSNPMVGVQNITWFEVNNFQVGDELHILEESSSWGGWDGEYGYSITNKANYKYIERIDYADSIVYRYSRKQSIETVTQDTTTLEIYVDTLKSVIIADPLFDKLPGEPIIDEINLAVYNYHMTSGTNPSKTKPVEGFYNRNDSCWGIIMYDGCLKNNTYFNGLGGPYYACTNCCSLGGEERKIVYYKKGETEWGEKLVITNVSEIKASNDLKVFPNPASFYITISNPSNIKIKKIELVDFLGRVVQIWDANEWTGNKLNIQHISPGIYFLKAKTDNGIKTKKLVVQ